MSKVVEQQSSVSGHRKQHQSSYYQKTYTFSDILRFKSKLELDEQQQQQQQDKNESRRVLFQNVRIISNQINRRPQYVMKFLSHCLQRTSFYNANRNVGVILPDQPLPQHQQHPLQHEIDFGDLRAIQDVVNKHLHAYVKKYVQCPACSCLQTLNPISQDNEVDHQNEEDFTFSISCRGCSAVTPLDVQDDPFLQDIAESRNRNAEKMYKQKRAMDGRNYEQNEAMGYYDASRGHPSTYYQQVNGTTYFDVPPPTANGPEMFYQNYYPPMGTPPMFGAPYVFNGMPPYQFIQGFPYGMPSEFDQLQHDDGMYTSDALEKEVFEQQQQLNLMQQQYFHSVEAGMLPIDPNMMYAMQGYSPAMYDVSSVEQEINGTGDNVEQQQQQNGTKPGIDEENVEAIYKSAGILPYSTHPKTKQVVFLLGKELRGGNHKPVNNRSTWSEFGGKKEKKDRDSVDTAVREFCEETAAVFRGENLTAQNVQVSKEVFTQSVNYLQSIIRNMSGDQLKAHSVYFAPGKYRLFLVQVPFIEIDVLAKAAEENKVKKVLPSTPKQEFKWVDARHLFDLICPQKKKKQQQEKQRAVSDIGLLQISPGEELHPFFVNLFRKSRPAIQRLLKIKESGVNGSASNGST